VDPVENPPPPHPHRTWREAALAWNRRAAELAAGVERLTLDEETARGEVRAATEAHAAFLKRLREAGHLSDHADENHVVNAMRNARANLTADESAYTALAEGLRKVLTEVRGVERPPVMSDPPALVEEIREVLAEARAGRYTKLVTGLFAVLAEYGHATLGHDLGRPEEMIELVRRVLRETRDERTVERRRADALVTGLTGILRDHAEAEYDTSHVTALLDAVRAELAAAYASRDAAESASAELRRVVREVAVALNLLDTATAAALVPRALALRREVSSLKEHITNVTEVVAALPRTWDEVRRDGLRLGDVFDRSAPDGKADR